MINRLHTVIFDAGGTLIDSDNIFEVISLATSKFGSPISTQDIEDEFMRLKKDLSLPFTDIKTLLSSILQKVQRNGSKQDIYNEVSRLYKKTFLETIKLYDGTIELLTALKKSNVKLILLSDADDDLLHAELDQLDIKKYFDHLLISSIMQSYKPSDKVIGCVKDVCPGSSDGVLMIGDSVDDINTAKKLGISSILISESQNVGSHGQTHTVRMLKEILPLLKNNFSLKEA